MWCAILGVTEQLLNEKCDINTYRAEILLLRDIRLKYNKDLATQETQDDYISVENEGPLFCRDIGTFTAACFIR